MVSTIMAGTGLIWVFICSIKSTIAASTYPGNCENITLPYTTKANIFITQSLSLLSRIYFLRKSYWTYSFFSFYLVFESRMLAFIFIIWANFFLNETFVAFFQKTLFGLGDAILSKAEYSSIVGVKSS